MQFNSDQLDTVFDCLNQYKYDLARRFGEGKIELRFSRHGLDVYYKNIYLYSVDYTPMICFRLCASMQAKLDMTKNKINFWFDKSELYSSFPVVF
jgi:hypothetical protein